MKVYVSYGLYPGNSDQNLSTWEVLHTHTGLPRDGMCNGLFVHRTLDLNFGAFLYLEWKSNRYYNSFVRHEGFQSSTRDMPAGYQGCWRTWSVDKLAGNRGNKVQGDFYTILFSTAWCICLKWLVVAVSFFRAFLLFHLLSKTARSTIRNFHL